jgi:hypothetical protein
MRVRLVGVALAIGCILSTVPAHAATITFAPQTVAPGDTLTVDVLGSQLTDVIAFGFDLGFDASVLAFTSASEGTFLSKDGGLTDFRFCPDADSGCPPDSTPPSVFSLLFEGSVSSTIPTQPELLATLVFAVIGAGDANLVLNSRLLDSQLNDIAPLEEVGGAITSVPEPSTLALLGVGLAAAARKRLKTYRRGN